tara:strand:- start:837 stop:1439 length:603 start_codon:yes stop_codon:yes gene_type:complete
MSTEKTNDERVNPIPKKHRFTSLKGPQANPALATDATMNMYQERVQGPSYIIPFELDIPKKLFLSKDEVLKLPNILRDEELRDAFTFHNAQKEMYDHIVPQLKNFVGPGRELKIRYMVINEHPLLIDNNRQEAIMMFNDDIEIEWYVGDIRPNIHRYRKEDLDYLTHKEKIKAGKVFQMKTDVIHQILKANGKVGITIYD